VVCHQLAGVAPYAVQVVCIVGAIVARRGGGQREKARLPAAQQIFHVIQFFQFNCAIVARIGQSLYLWQACLLLKRKKVRAYSVGLR
jgi:hypothetical protein